MGQHVETFKIPRLLAIWIWPHETFKECLCIMEAWSVQTSLSHELLPQFWHKNQWHVSFAGSFLPPLLWSFEIDCTYSTVSSRTQRLLAIGNQVTNLRIRMVLSLFYLLPVFKGPSVELLFCCFSQYKHSWMKNNENTRIKGSFCDDDCHAGGFLWLLSLWF